MFDIFAKLLSSIVSFLFPLFASYKALKTSDPAQLTPWLMYWVVLGCGLLVESWIEWFLVWIPFYAYFRLFFLLYLVLPQTQGARLIYQTHVHPWMEENETAIEDLIATAHDRIRSTGTAYLRRALEYIRTNVLGLPPSQDPAPTQAPATQTPQSYTQSLLARFALPGAGANTGAGVGAGATASGDLYSLLASAVNAATSAATGSGAAGQGEAPPADASERISFIATQRERLGILLSALDREETQLQGAAAEKPAGELGKSRSEADFVKLEAESRAEDVNGGGGARKRAPTASGSGSVGGGGGGWMPWAWGSAGASASGEAADGRSSAVEQ